MNKKYGALILIIFIVSIFSVLDSTEYKIYDGEKIIKKISTRTNLCFSETINPRKEKNSQKFL